MRRDTFTNTVEDAAAYEQLRGSVEDIDPRPTAAEILRDDAGQEVAADVHECGDNCLACAWWAVSP